MPKLKFTHQLIKGIEVEKRTDFYDTIESGLAIRVSKKGTKTFFYRYRFSGKNKRFTIGRFPGIGLSDARKRVQKLKVKVNDGIDPQAEKQKKKNQTALQTFKELADEYLDKHVPTRKPKTQEEYTRIVNNELIPAFGKYPISDITRGMIISLMDEIAIKREAPTMANRIRSRLSTIYNFAIERGLAEKNPVNGIKNRSEGENSRDRYYKPEEIKRLWESFSNQPEPAQSIFKMLLLTGQRKGETSRMRWEDIRGDIWTIPAKDAKNGKPHDVPLSSFALDIIKNIRPLTGESNYVFESSRRKNKPTGYIDRPKNQIKKESGVKGFRPHDLRRTVATYMAKLGVERTTLGKILNHKGLAGDSQVTAIYDRHSYMDEKRKAMNRWSKKLKDILEGKTEAKIVDIRY